MRWLSNALIGVCLQLPLVANAQASVSKMGRADSGVGRVFQALERLARSNPAAAERRLAKAPLTRELRARIEGVIALTRGRPLTALEAFERARVGDVADPRLELHVAHAALSAGLPKRALGAVTLANSLASQAVAQPLLHARTLSALKRDGEAFAVLLKARQRFPESLELLADGVQLLVRMHLRRLARTWARSAIDRLTAPGAAGAAPTESEKLLPIARRLSWMLYRDRSALPLLERLGSRFPEDGDVQGHVARAYAAWGDHHVAAQLFDRAVALGGDFAFEAAEQYGLAGQARRGLRFNARVFDRRRRLQQRVFLLLESGQLARVVAAEPSLRRQGALSPRTTYALAYAHYRLGAHLKASRLLDAIRADPKYGEVAKRLLSTMGRTGS